METIDKERELQKLVGRIVEAVHPVRLILFGSAARGEAGSQSDIDILVVMPDGTHRRRTAQYLYRHVEGVRIPYDLAVATESDLERYGSNPGLILKSVLEEGRTLYAA